MSLLEPKDLRFPLSNGTLRKLMGHLFAMVGELVVVSTTTFLLKRNGVSSVVQAGNIQDLYFIAPVIPAAGESVVVDVEKSTDGGSTWATILSSTKTINATTYPTAGVQVSLVELLATASKYVAAGSMLRASLTYVAGGGPTPLAYVAVGVEIGRE